MISKSLCLGLVGIKRTIAVHAENVFCVSSPQASILEGFVSHGYASFEIFSFLFCFFCFFYASAHQKTPCCHHCWLFFFPTSVKYLIFFLSSKLHGNLNYCEYSIFF